MELGGLPESVSSLLLSSFIFLFIMQAMGSITPIAIKSIRITVVITGNTMARYKLEVVGLLGTLKAASTGVVVVSIA